MTGGLGSTTIVITTDLPEPMCDVCHHWSFRKRSAYSLDDNGVVLVWSETYCGHCRLDARG
jgi:hypothetical protein